MTSGKVALSLSLSLCFCFCFVIVSESLAEKIFWQRKNHDSCLFKLKMHSFPLPFLCYSFNVLDLCGSGAVHIQFLWVFHLWGITIPHSCSRFSSMLSCCKFLGFDINRLVLEAHCRWLKPAEVLFVLQNHGSYQITHKAPQLPTSGSLFLFNKRVLRGFRKDGHNWRKKKDGKNVSEAHERLKVDNVEALSCYYVRREDNPNFQRRCYWMLDPAYEHIVLVHYRNIKEDKPNSGSISELAPGSSYTLSHSVNTRSIKNQGTASLSDLHGSYQSLSSPRSMEVSSKLVAERQGTDCFNNLDRAGNVSTLPIVEVSQTLRRLEEQVGLDDDSFKVYGLFDNEKQDIDGTVTLQQHQYCGEDDGMVSSSIDDASWLEIASLFDQEDEHFDLLAYPSEFSACGINTPVYHSILSGPDQFQMALEADPSLTIAQKQKFKIRQVSPEWGFANEVTKVIVIGSFLCNPSEIAWACMFGDIEVPVQIIQDGVLSCEAPLKCPGKVSIFITSGNQEVCSEVKEFEYLDKHTCGSCISTRQEETKTTEELSLLVRFVQMLLSDSSVQKGEGNHSGIVSRIQKGHEDSDNISKAPLTGSGTSYGTVDWVLHELLKDKLQRWLFARFLKGDENLGCTLSKKEQGIIHVIAALGYEWALNPILSFGVGVNFRDINGWTALHWAARFGREKMVAALIASGASAGVVTDPTAHDPLGKKPGTVAAESGHKGLAGYLSEIELTTHLSSLTFKEIESMGFTNMEEEATIRNISRPSVAFGEDQHSMEQTLEAARNATIAAARIQAAFRAPSLRKREQREVATSAKSGVDEYGFTSDEAWDLSAASKLVFHDRNAAALSIQKNYRCWKDRRGFLKLRQNAVKIQAHVRGHQVRKKYEVICWAVGILEKVVLRWRRKRAGLRGYKPRAESVNGNAEYEDILQDFRRQKVDLAINKAVSRVLSMMRCLAARQQYSRMLERFREAKAKLVILTADDASASRADVLAMDND